MTLRRSARIRALQGGSSHEGQQISTASATNEPTQPKKRKRTISKSTKSADKKSQSAKKKDKNCDSSFLPRTREMEIKAAENPHANVIGIDEAGRGPLAGPVVAAAIIAPFDLNGVVDSKKVTKEDEREKLYEELIAMKDVRWAVSIMDAARIDEINILQATLEGMSLAATALVDRAKLSVRVAQKASVEESGCYVVCSSPPSSIEKKKKSASKDKSNYYALIDGNKVPKEMPCMAESMVKGDSREFSIAAASILAKVTRDRLMHGYDQLYPQFNLKQHKGYPTAAHMQTVKEHGASPIHRRTFAPLKHMQFDENGNIIEKQED